MNPSTDLPNILILDDHADLANLYKTALEAEMAAHVTVLTNAETARMMADSQLFDFLVIDAKLEYRGLEFGGLKLAEELLPRYGAGSIVVISRYITPTFMREYGTDGLEFLVKDGDRAMTFGSALCCKLKDMREKQFAFVAMPFSDKYNDLYVKFIKPAIEQTGTRCLRADEVSHTKGIHDQLTTLIRKSKLVAFLADDANPNAYYEAGFADALQKAVIIIAKSQTVPKVDLRHRYTLYYGVTPSSLVTSIPQLIRGLRSRPPGRP